MRLRIGTRRSRLAMAQAEEVAALLRSEGHEPDLVPMTTAGDRGASPASSSAGAKGLFVGDIDDALLRGDIDLAVHSAKDLPSDDPPGLAVVAVPKRNLPYDVLVTRDAEMPERRVVGTSSLRRRAQYLRMDPGAEVRDLRGNVDTRLRRLEERAMDGVILAAAGLDRLGARPANTSPLPVDDMVPAPGQGALAVQAAVGSEAAAAAAALDHRPSRVAFEAERRVVAMLGGGCRLPLGAYAEWRDDAVRLIAVVAHPDGSGLIRSEEEAAAPQDAAGRVADELLAQGAGRILEAVRE